MKLQNTIRVYLAEPKSEDVESIVKEFFETLGLKHNVLSYQKNADNSFTGTVEIFDNRYAIKIEPDGKKVKLKSKKLSNPEYEIQDFEKIEAVFKKVFEGYEID